MGSGTANEARGTGPGTLDDADELALLRERASALVYQLRYTPGGRLSVTHPSIRVALIELLEVLDPAKADELRRAQ